MAFESTKIEVISRSLIKPSSSTPDHLRRLKLSVFDQVQVVSYIPILFFYEADELKGLTTSTDHGGLYKTLQESLSVTLSLFYPVAGELDAEEFSIICNDGGVEFIEARAHARIEDMLLQRDLGQVQEYFSTTCLYSIPSKLFSVQINFFDCGGIVVGACMSHKIADGWSMIEFMNFWAATCRGEKRDVPYKFGPLGQNIPARDLSELNISMDHLMRYDQFVRKRFVFDKDQLAELKTAAGDNSFANPTRVEALSAFIWKNSIDNYMAEGKKRFAGSHLVNFRARESISFHFQGVIGNAVISTVAFIDQADVFVDGGLLPTPPLPKLVSELRKAIRKIDGEYIEKTHTELLYVKELEHNLDIFKRREVDEFFLFNSWTRFPIYEVDFGWGRPAWVFVPSVPVNNAAHFLSTKDGQGIEAWICLPPHHMESMEKKYKRIGSES